MEDFLNGQVPAAVREVEISKLQSITGLEGYRQAYVIFRYQGTVIGREWFPVTESCVEHEVLRRHCDQFAWQIWQRRHGQPPASRADISDVSVIVCTRDRTADLANCLPALHGLVPHVREVIIVDSCPSNDSTRNLVANYPELRYVHEARPGLGLARNTGIGASSGEFIAFTDDDAIIENQWLENLLRNFSDPLVAVATGNALPIELETAAQVWFEKTNSFVKRFDRRVYQAYYTPPLLAGITGAGVNLAIRRSALGEIGLFSVALGPGTPSGTGDDHEFLYRVLARGWKIVFDPEAIVWHRHRRDWEGLRRTIYNYGKGVYAWWTRALLEEKETTVFWYASKWFLGFQLHNLLRSALGMPSDYPFDMAWSEFRGALAGPIGYLKARRWKQTLPGLNQAGDLLSTYSPESNQPPLESVREHELPSLPATKSQAIQFGRSPVPKVSVIIPTHNRSELLAKSLHALAKQSYPPDLFEVVIVADSCTDNTVTMAKDMSRTLPYQMRIYQHDARSASATRNLGAQEARGEILLFLDDDIVADKRLVEAHSVAAGSNTVVLGYSKPVIGDDRSLWQLYARVWWEDHFLEMRDPGHRYTYRDFYSGNVSLPSELYWRVGGFDPDIRMRLEDYELGYRLLKKGAKFRYQPEALGLHHDITKLQTWLERTCQEGAADVLICKKHSALVQQVFAPNEVKWQGLWKLIRWSSFHPSWFLAFMYSLAVKLTLFSEALHQRGAYWRLTGALRQYQYWRGVADVIGSAAALDEFLQDVPFSDYLESSVLELDAQLMDDEKTIDDVLKQAGQEGVRLTYAGEEVATLITQPGEESLRLAHVQRFYRDYLTNNFLPALVVHQLRNKERPNAD